MRVLMIDRGSETQMNLDTISDICFGTLDERTLILINVNGAQWCSTIVCVAKKGVQIYD
ncbi:hypothetical protein F444_11692 [Phytophthora nicotianae P1976]|uniref:Uncharacterized protein n=1 Tax=Phytophthora nicotianae P1976 TaxID=1317066 RepID=A0A080ZZL8_PHYNI|nr:hypothetical protein F444_11692 [Phytophthora nicotianae P1976]